MKILKFIFFIPYWVVYYIISVPSCILNITHLLWSALGARMGINKVKFSTSREEQVEFINTVTTLVNGEENQK